MAISDRPKVVLSQLLLSNRGSLSRIEEILRRLYEKRRTKKKYKSSRKQLERTNLDVDDSSFPISNDGSMIQMTRNRHRHRSLNRRAYNVYSYYYPKYDMSYGHCLYVTPWTLDVHADKTFQIAQLTGGVEMRLESLERNWRMIGWKRRVNSPMRSFTFPANAEWDSTIYYFPRWDLSFYPLPMSRIRPQIGVNAAYPVETVLEEDKEDPTSLEDSSHLEDSSVFEKRNTQCGSCKISTRDDLSSRSPSSAELTSRPAIASSRNPRSLDEHAIRTLPCVDKDVTPTLQSSVEDIRLKPSTSQISEEIVELKTNQATLTEFESGQNIEKLRSSHLGEMEEEGEHRLKRTEDFFRATRPHHVLKSRTYRLDSPTQFSEQVSHNKPVNIQLNETVSCESLPEDCKLCPCSQHNRSDSQVKSNWIPLIEGPKSGLHGREYQVEENKLHSVEVFRGDEHRQESNNKSSDVDNQRKSNTGRRYQGERQEANLHSGSIVVEPRYVDDIGLLDVRVRPGDDADDPFMKNIPTTATDDLLSINDTNCEIVSLNEMNDTVPTGNREGDFISGSCNTIRPTFKDLRDHTFSGPEAALSIKETKQLRRTLETLKFGPLRVDRSVEGSSISVTHAIIYKSELVVHSSVGLEFDVETDRHMGNRSEHADLNKESHHQSLSVPTSSTHSCTRRVYTRFKEESLSIGLLEKQAISRKRSRVERKTAMRKLTFVRPSSAVVSHGAESAGNILRQGHTLTENSTADFPQQRHIERRTAQSTTGQSDCCKSSSSHFVELTESRVVTVGEDIQDLQKSSGLSTSLQDPQPPATRESPKTYLSIWQNRRACYANFLKRHPTLLFYP